MAVAVAVEAATVKAVATAVEAVAVKAVTTAVAVKAATVKTHARYKAGVLATSQDNDEDNKE
jgi:hypothetical protein